MWFVFRVWSDLMRWIRRIQMMSPDLPLIDDPAHHWATSISNGNGLDESASPLFHQKQNGHPDLGRHYMRTDVLQSTACGTQNKRLRWLVAIPRAKALSHNFGSDCYNFRLQTWYPISPDTSAPAIPQEWGEAWHMPCNNECIDYLNSQVFSTSRGWPTTRTRLIWFSITLFYHNVGFSYALRYRKAQCEHHWK